MHIAKLCLNIVFFNAMGISATSLHDHLQNG